MRRLPTLILALAAALPLAAAAGACGDSPNAVNLELTDAVRAALPHAYAAAYPGTRPELVPGRTYYGFHVGIRYAVAKNNTNCSVTPPANTRLFTHKLNLKTYGLSCQPNDLIVCKSADRTGADVLAHGIYDDRKRSHGIASQMIEIKTALPLPDP